MPRNYRNAMVLPALLAAVSCRGHAARTAPADPIEAVAPAPLPVGSLGGTNVLLLTVGGVVFADSAALLQPRTDSILAGANAALDTALRRDAREVTWEGLAEQRHVMRRNPTFEIDPDRLPTSYLIGAKVTQVPDPLWADIRTLAALTNSRFAVVPVAARIGGGPGGYTASFVLVVADARTGAVLWRGRTEGPRAATPEAALVGAAQRVVPNPLAPPTPPPAQPGSSGVPPAIRP